MTATMTFGGATGIFNTLAEAKTADIPVQVELIETHGYSAAGDGGGAIYKRLPAEPVYDPANLGYFEDANNGWWGLASLDANVRMFGCVGDGTTNDQTGFQNAIDYAFNVLNTNLYVPSGTYQVETLVLPGRSDPPTIDHRNRRFKLFGQGNGEGYAIFGGAGGYNEAGGTKIIGATNATVLTCDDAYPLGGSSGLEICDLCFIAKGAENPNPVVELRLVQNSSFHHNILYQEGVGDGLHILMVYQSDIAWNRIFNKFWISHAGQTGAGIRLFNIYSPSQVTIRNNTTRGFYDAGILGDEGLAHADWQTFLLYNEASACYNGWTLHACNGSLVMGNYVEGSQGGTCFIDRSQEVSYIGNFLFEGFSVGFDLSDPASRGAKISNSTIKMGSKENAVGIKVVNAGHYNWTASITDSFFESQAGTNGVKGIDISGASAAVNISGNEFNPRTAWTGVNAFKIRDTTANVGLIGLVMYDDPAFTAYQGINCGQISFTRGALTDADVSSSVLTIGPKNFLEMTAGAPVAINRIVRSVGSDTTQVTIRLTDANVTFANSFYVKLDGGTSFVGPGSITFNVVQIGTNHYAYEMSRTTYI